MKELLAKLNEYWVALDENDRSAIQIGGGLATILLVVGLVIMPALNSYEHLQKSLPQMRKQLATMRAQSLEASRLRSNPPALQVHESILSLLESSTNLHGIKPQVQSLTPQNHAATIRFKDVEYSRLLKWLAGLRSQYHIQASEAEFTRSASPAGPGTVDAYLVFPDPNA